MDGAKDVNNTICNASSDSSGTHELVVFLL
jgi:hypothetical protein